MYLDLVCENSFIRGPDSCLYICLMVLYTMYETTLRGLNMHSVYLGLLLQVVLFCYKWECKKRVNSRQFKTVLIQDNHFCLCVVGLSRVFLMFLILLLQKQCYILGRQRLGLPQWCVKFSVSTTPWCPLSR